MATHRFALTDRVAGTYSPSGFPDSHLALPGSVPRPYPFRGLFEWRTALPVCFTVQNLLLPKQHESTRDRTDVV